MLAHKAYLNDHVITLASMNPSAMSIFSQIRTRSGTITVIGRKSAFNPWESVMATSSKVFLSK